MGSTGHYILLVYEFITLVLILFLLARYVYHIVKDDEDMLINLSKLHKYAAAGAFGFYTMASLVCVGCHIVLVSTSKDSFELENTRASIGFFYCCGLLTLLTIFIDRLRVVVSDNRIIPKKKLKCIGKYIATLVLLILILFIFTGIDYIAQRSKNSDYQKSINMFIRDGDMDLWMISGIIGCVFYVLVSFSILFLFIYIVFKIGTLLLRHAQEKQLRLTIIENNREDNIIHINRKYNDSIISGNGKVNVNNLEFGVKTSIDNDANDDEYMMMGIIRHSEWDKQISNVSKDGNMCHMHTSTDTNTQTQKNQLNPTINGEVKLQSILIADEKQERRLGSLVQNMTVYTVLVSIGIISTLLNGIMWYFIDDDLIRRLVLTNDILINSICLHLQFPFSRNLYSYICRCCHVNIEKEFWVIFNLVGIKQSGIELSKFYQSHTTLPKQSSTLLMYNDINKNKTKNTKKKFKLFKNNTELSSPLLKNLKQATGNTITEPENAKYNVNDIIVYANTTGDMMSRMTSTNTDTNDDNHQKIATWNSSSFD